MSNQSREKIALFVFMGLIVLSLCGLGWYLLAGHSWNVAASNIDDTFGSMDDYTAIVYPGTQEPELTTKNETSALDESVKNDVSSFDIESQVAVPEATAGSLTKKKTVSVEEAKESYEAKNATVFALDTDNLGRYAEGTILKKGGHRFGVFSVEEPLSSIVIEKQLAYLSRYAVDFVVVLTTDKAYVEGMSGIDIVICTQDEELFVMGETHSGTFYVDAPEIGRVGAILISPSNVVSAKVIEEL